MKEHKTSQNASNLSNMMLKTVSELSILKILEIHFMKDKVKNRSSAVVLSPYEYCVLDRQNSLENDLLTIMVVLTTFSGKLSSQLKKLIFSKIKEFRMQSSGENYSVLENTIYDAIMPLSMPIFDCHKSSRNREKIISDWIYPSLSDVSSVHTDPYLMLMNRKSKPSVNFGLQFFVLINGICLYLYPWPTIVTCFSFFVLVFTFQ
jgi:hypothetical protein